MSGKVNVLLELPEPYVVPIILNKSLKAILLTILPSQINHPIGATEPANISITPVGMIGVFIGSNELPFGELVGIEL